MFEDESMFWRDKEKWRGKGLEEQADLWYLRSYQCAQALLDPELKKLDDTLEYKQCELSEFLESSYNLMVEPSGIISFISDLLREEVSARLPCYEL
jgi:hypothetical protein